MSALLSRAALRAAGLTLAVLAAAGSAALAQPYDPPPACASATTMMTHKLFNRGSGATGLHWVTVDFVSPINADPFNLVENGFTRICNYMGFTPGVPTDVDGDAISDNALLTQFDGETGTVKAVTCTANFPAVAWTPGQGVQIEVSLSQDPFLVAPFPAATFCTQAYPALVLGAGVTGYQLAPIPTLGVAATREDICVGLNLPTTAPFFSTVTTVDGQFGVFNTHICGSLAVPPALKAGEAALVKITGPLPPGSITNCATPPCGPGPWPPFTHPCLPLFGVPPILTPTFCP